MSQTTTRNEDIFRVHISSTFSCNSEAVASELLENNEDNVSSVIHTQMIL